MKEYIKCGVLIYLVALSLVIFSKLHAEILFQDTFDSGSVTDPASRATGSLASAVKYAFTNNSNGEVAIVSGNLDWTGANASNGDLAAGNDSQLWTFVYANGTAYDWSSDLAGKAYDIRFTWRTAWAHPLTFGLSDNPQGGAWNAYENGGYDFAFGAYGNAWRTGEDGAMQNVAASNVGNSVFDVLIRVNEVAGTVEAYVNDTFVAARSIDFENSGRYLSFGEPTQFGGYVDDFAVSIVQPDVASVSGNWSAASTWLSNSVPGTSFVTNESDVLIPEGVTVTLDTNVEIGTLIVRGTLTAANSNISLIADSVVVEGVDASFELGTANNRYAGDFTLTLKGQPNETYTPAGHGNDLGARALLVHMGATLSLHGEDRLEWTKLAATANVNATSIVVAGAVDWKAGDQLLIAPSRNNINQFDRITVGSTAYNSANDTTTVIFQNGQRLNHWHLGVIQQRTRPAGVHPERTWTVDMRAEVALMNRNITIQSRIDSQTNNGFGGHVMIHGPMAHMGTTMPTGEAYVQAVAFKNMGQRSLLGRYPFHWHMVLDSTKGGSIQQYLKDSVIDKSFNRGITIHGTDRTLVDNNVAYDMIGHGVFFEDGSERFNTITNNVMLRAVRPLAGQELLESERIGSPQNRGPASYWITNPNNTINNNIAAGSPGTGFWYAMPTRPMGLSGNEPYFNGLQPHKQPLGSFVGNTAHSLGNGFDIFDRVTDANLPNDLILNFGWDHAAPHIFKDFTAYACEEGIYCGLGAGGPYENNIFDNAVIAENKQGLFLAANMEIRNSLFLANSGYQLSNSHVVYRYYDGPSRLINCHFVGFNTNTASFVEQDGGATVYPNVYIEGATTNHTERLIFKKNAFAQSVDPKRYSTIFYDADGLVTQTNSGKSIIPDHPFLKTGNEVRPASWVNFLYNEHRYVNFYAYVPGTGIAATTMTRTKAGTSVAQSRSPSQGHHHQFPVIVNDDFLYTFQMDALPPQRQIYLRNYTHNIGAYAYTMCYKHFGKLAGVRVRNQNIAGGLVAMNSFDAVNNSTVPAYYIQPNGDIFVRHAREGTFRITWSNQPAVWPPVDDSDGDGVSDPDEIASGLNPFDASDSLASFNTNGNFEQWNALSETTGQTVSGGVLSATSLGDPKIRSNGLSIDTSKVSTIFVRMKANVDTTMQMFWIGSNGGESADRVVSASYDTPDEWAVLSLDMGSHPGWSGTTTSLRLDPIGGAGTFEIDWIKFSDGDRDNDGLADVYEGYGDLDEDGTEDFDDYDSDNDGLSDGADPDTNPNGFALMCEVWDAVSGSSITDIPLETVPDRIEYLGQFATDETTITDSAARLSGYIQAPTTGNYTFWVSGDDQCELRLKSTGDTTDPGGAQIIASIPGYTAFEEWNKYQSQQSVPIELVAGQYYYIEALQKQGVGLAHVAVAWSGPGFAREIIDGQYITPYTPAATGSASLERWDGIPEDTINTIPLISEPDSVVEISSLDIDSNGDDYGQRIRSYLHPLESGDYTFWIAGDNDCELWLSTDDQKANKRLIASVAGFTANKEWTKFSTQTSVPQSLVAGKSYYLEVLHKEGVGGDHVAVAWELNSNPESINPQVISSLYLSRWSNDRANGIHKHEPMSLPFTDDFAAYTVGQSIDGLNDWLLEGVSGVVSTSNSSQGAKALRLSGTTAINHSFTSTEDIVWSDFEIMVTPYPNGTTPEISNSTSSALYFDATGQIYVRDGEVWQAPAIELINLNQYQRITVRMDYAAQTYDLWLNNVLVAQNMQFANPNSSFQRFQASNFSTRSALLDTFSAMYTEPEKLDNDGDLLPNKWERLQGLNENDDGSSNPDNGYLGDPDKDGYDNYWELVHGLNPFIPEKDKSMRMFVDENTNELALHIRESIDYPDGFILEKSNDLKDWETMEMSFLEIDPDIDGNGVSRLLEIRLPLMSDHAFFRMSKK